MKRAILTGLFALALTSGPTHAYQINGWTAELVSCDYGYSAVRGESGYTGTYRVVDEIVKVYFGEEYCPA